MIDIATKVEGGFLPTYGSVEAAGADLYSAMDITIFPNTCKLVGTGVYVEIPEGYAGFIQPRSGLALKHQITVLNSPGLIDSDYRGELKVLLMNHHPWEKFEIKAGDRIAQLVVQKVERCDFVLKELSSSARGEGGFGSTGSR